MYRKENKNNKKNLEKKEKGITLVALVITVVVMLILAGVAIAAVVDGDGLFSKTRQAAEAYENAADKESYMLENLIGQIDHYIEGGTSGGGDITEGEEGSPIASVVEVGDFVNYDAGTWNQSTDTSKITSSGGSVTWSEELPTSQGQFGGFTAGQSRNSNSTPRDINYTPNYSGWRVWDIDESTGRVTLISAGHSETYYHGSENAKEILQNRNWSMYENEYAKSGSANILTRSKLNSWYQKYIDPNIYDVYNYVREFPTVEDKPLITVLENNSYYWIEETRHPTYLYFMNPASRKMSSGNNGVFGIRILVTLESDVQVKEGTSTGGITTWDIVGN